MTAIERDTPLPDLADEVERLTEAALTWIEDRIHDEPEWSIDRVVASASEPMDADDEAAAVIAWFHVDDDKKAEWAMARLAEIEAEGERVAELAEEWISKYERWREDRMRPLNARHAYMTHLLTSYLRRLREADPKCKSRPLPSGDILSRAVAPKVEIMDELAVLQWVRDSDADEDDIVKTVQSVRLTEFKKAVTIDAEAGVVRDPSTGQPIPGTAVSPGGASFSVKVSGG